MTANAAAHTPSVPRRLLGDLEEISTAPCATPRSAQRAQPDQTTPVLQSFSSLVSFRTCTANSDLQSAASCSLRRRRFLPSLFELELLVPASELSSPYETSMSPSLVQAHFGSFPSRCALPAEHKVRICHFSTHTCAFARSTAVGRRRPYSYIAPLFSPASRVKTSFVTG